MKYKSILLAYVCFSTTLSGAFSSEVFQYDDREQARGLHYSLRGTNKINDKWEAHEVKEADIPFHQKLFADQKVMKHFANGQPRTPQSTEDRIRNQWMPRSHSGQPHSGMTVFIEGLPKGHVVAGGGDEPGASEVAYSFLPDAWNKGLATSIVHEIVTQWAPETRRIGLGRGLAESEGAIQNAFTCFGGQILSRLDATASPNNVGSWKALLNNNFEAAMSRLVNQEPIIDLREMAVKPEDTSEQIVKFFNIKDGAYQEGKRYRLRDQKNSEKTFSVRTEKIEMAGNTQDIKVVKYHFEYAVE